MSIEIARPKLEGKVAIGTDRQHGFAEFGDSQGRTIFWLHGTPGGRRQIHQTDRRARTAAVRERVSEGDRRILVRPEFKARFLDFTDRNCVYRPQ